MTSYDPEASGKPNLQKIPPGSNVSPVIEGFAKCTGDLNVSGGLKLDGGVLYVDGNLNVDGGIRGKGALFVTKGLKLYGSTQMETDNKVAVLAGGDVTIFGSGQESSLFQGMLYNEGSFTAQHITLMGVFIQNKEGAPVEISDSSLYYQAGQSKLDVSIKSTGPPDLSKGNLHIKPILGILTPILGQSEAVFEAYPVSTPAGHWELVDPNSRQIISLPSKAAVLTEVKKIWNASGSSTSGGLLGYGSDGKATVLVVPQLPLIGDLLFSAQFDQLNGVAVRQPGASQMLPNSTEKIVVDPSRFLSLKDRVRLLYWRAR